MSASHSNSTVASYEPPADLDRLQRRGWIVGAVGVAACLAGWALNPIQFFQSYLVAWLFWLGIAVGSLAVLMLQYLTGGRWGLMIRRTLEAATRTLPALGVLFLPIVFGMQTIFPWARPEAATDELIRQKAAYLNPTSFTLRGFLYLAIWALFAFILSWLSLKQDRTAEPGLSRRMQMVAAPGLAIYCLLATFASVDWLMSLDPHWYSSVFGVYFIVGQGLSALAFLIVMAVYLSQREPMGAVFRPLQFHDYGKLMLAFVMLWAYIALSQLLIIWSANLPEEVGWYLERSHGIWKYVSILLALFHFFLPFVLLLSRDLKRDAKRLSRVAILVLCMRFVDLYWLAAPSFGHEGLSFHWLDLATVLAVGGVWFALFTGQLRRRPLLPINDPLLEEALADD
jgi:hypothetical protein